MKVLNVNLEKCTGCRLCEMACSFGRFGYFSAFDSAIRIVRGATFFEYFPQVCTQCVDAFCARACPTGALQRKGSIVDYNKLQCILCRQCLLACPWGFIYPDTDLQYMIKCDLCGGDPECVRVCFNDAIEYVEVADVSNTKYRGNVARAKGERK